ncbi:type II toxin-antitoxin system RelE/ParE family toxin [Alphaproteobacteria bacterium LSUCC0719]
MDTWQGGWAECRLAEPVDADPLARLDAAIRPEDMNEPGLRFHALGGEMKGRYSVRVTGNWRVTFAWDGENAVDVDLEDYH